MMNSARSGALRRVPVWSRCLLLSGFALLTGCAALPSAGPQRSDIRDQSKAQPLPGFRIVDLDERSLQAGQQRTPPGFAETFGEGAPSPMRIDVGDRISVEIWEAGSTPLFARPATGAGTDTAAASTRSTTLADQTVGSDGDIVLPFAGRIAVKGRTGTEVEKQIVRALAGKTVRPQVIVRVRSESKAVTVLGEVAAGSRVPLSARGERLLDVLAATGGVRAPAHEARIQLTRAGRTLSLPLRRLLQEPRQNIVLQPGDLVVATRQPQSFTAFGATGRNAQIEFGSEELSLIEAVAKTGGLLDNRADPRGVYLFRHEPRAVLEPAAARAANGGAELPVIYRLDLSEARSYFLAQRFALRDRDILYVSSAPASELQKFLELVGLVTQPVIQGAVIRGAVK